MNVNKAQRRRAFDELRVYSTAALLVIAECSDDEVCKRALDILKERGLDEKASKEEWAAAWRSTDSLMDGGGGL
jgi:hypothetical protein